LIVGQPAAQCVSFVEVIEHGEGINPTKAKGNSNRYYKQKNQSFLEN
jgi:hypothetical protein